MLLGFSKCFFKIISKLLGKQHFILMVIEGQKFAWLIVWHLLIDCHVQGRPKSLTGTATTVEMEASDNPNLGKNILL